MINRLLLDENVSPEYREQLLRDNPDLTVWLVGSPGAPARGALDPDILTWCELHGFALVTNNRHSMPRHLADHMTAGSHILGIFTIRPGAEFGRVLDDLLLIAEASGSEDYADQIVYLPL